MPPVPLRRPPAPCRGHEGEGSVFAYLKAKGWASGLVAGEVSTAHLAVALSPLPRTPLQSHSGTALPAAWGPWA